MLKVGTDVMLKSGGPVMKVVTISEESQSKTFVRCSWYDDSGQLISAEFIKETLNQVNPSILLG